MKNEIQQELFALHPYDVVKATYKDSVYYIAGAYNISAYVPPDIKEGHEKVELQASLDRFLRIHPECNELKVPKFDVVLLDDKFTSVQFVNMFCTDVLHFSPEECFDVVEALNSVGTYHVGTYSDEMAQTIGHLLEEANIQLKQNLGWDKIERDPAEEHYKNSMVVLEKLIRRDYPADI